MTNAVIDISSTGVSLLIQSDDGDYSYTRREGFPSLRYTVDGRLNADGITKICEKVIMLQRICQHMPDCIVDNLYVLATASLRYITNSEDVIEVIKKYTGAEVNVVDAAMEGKCSLASNERFRGMGDPVIIDIGGSSIEMGSYTSSEICCLDFGALSLKARFVAGAYPSEEEYKKIKKYIKGALLDFDVTELCDDSETRMAVFSGTLSSSIYKLYCKVFSEPLDEDRTADPDKLAKLAKKVLTSDQRSQLLIETASGNVEYLGVALVIISRMVKELDFRKVCFSESGVKEGFLKLLERGEIEAIPSGFEPAPSSDKKIETLEELTKAIKKRAKKAPPKVVEAKKPAAPADGRKDRKAKNRQADSPKDAPAASGDAPAGAPDTPQAETSADIPEGTQETDGPEDAE
ncbi:MAG: hypothetical protein LUD51_03750 [Clostridia bacterium]|nr:hypothetical protein [Clostridia bacterium]